MLPADTVTIDLASQLDAPTYRAAGFIYGLSEDASSPAQNMLSDIKVKYLRVGGAQLGCPNGGWINSSSNYTRRWNAVKAYYAKAQAIGATTIILPHDLWGADLVCTVNTWPGDSGNWTNYTNFMTQVINDAKAAGMTGSNVQWDIWNEPDCCGFFGGRPESQYLEMWKRGYQQIRAAIPNAVITGPSFSAQPAGGWYPAYLDYIKANNVVPNVFSWHEEGGGNDPNTTKAAMDSALSSRGISHPNPYNVNEYGTSSEQNPGHSAWFLARYTRNNMAGLRGNWGMNSGLWAGMGDLVTSSGQPLGQWWIYKRYADMTGQLVSVTPGSQVDAVAGTDSGAKKTIIVVGNKGGVTGSVNVVINSIPSYLQNGGTTQVLVERMPTGSSYVSAPTVVSNSAMAVSNNSLTVSISWGTATDGYAITLTPGSGGPTPTPTRTPTPPPGGSQLEAENATRAGGACVMTDHTGYTGTGFVACYTSVGPSTTFNVSKSAAGNYAVTLRYSAGPNGPASNRTVSIYVNGTDVLQTSLPRTTDWNTWATKTETLSLRAGSNTIKYQYDSSDTGWINLDNIVVGN